MNTMQEKLRELHEEHMKKIAHLIAAAGRIEEADAVCEALNAQMPSAEPLKPSVAIKPGATAAIQITAYECDHSITRIRNAINDAGLIIERELATFDCANNQETILWLQGIDTRIIWRGQAVEMAEAA